MDYLKVSLVIAPQFLAGCLIYLMLLKRSTVKIVELLSIGGVLGITACTIFDQLFVNLNLPRIGWITAIGIVLATFFVFKSLLGHETASIVWKNEFRSSILPICAIAIMALGTEWFWMFPSGVFFVTAAFISRAPKKKASSVLFKMCCLGGLVFGILMFSNRPKIWWFMYEYDYPFLQALSRSLSDWGLNDYVLLSGTRTKYHWFTYAWIGLVERSAGSSIFFVLTKVAPAVFALLIAGLSWSQISRTSRSQLRTFVFSLIVMTASSYPLWGYGAKITFLASPSQFFTTAFLFATVSLLVSSTFNEIRFSALLIAILSSVVMLSKTMHGVILVCAIAFFTLVKFLFSRHRALSHLAKSLLYIASALTTFFIFVANSEGRAVFEIRFGDFFWQLQGDARLLPDRYVDIFGLLTILAFSLIPLVLIATASFSPRISQDDDTLWLSIGAIFGGVVLSLAILSAYGENLYFLQAAIGLSSLLGFSNLANKSFVQLTSRQWVSLCFLGGVLCWLSFRIPSYNSGTQPAIVIRSFRVYLPATILLSIASILIGKNIRKRSSGFDSLFKLLVVASAMAVGFSFANWSEVISRKHNEFRRDGQSYFGTPELKEAAEWINKNTDDNAIIASNYGWPIIQPSESALFSSPCVSFRQKEVLVETCRRTSSALLVSYIHRRTWLQTTALHYTGFTPKIAERQSISLGFSSSPDTLHLQRMLKDGVEWFVVDRSTTGRESWLPLAEIEFSNEQYFVLKLHEDN